MGGAPSKSRPSMAIGGNARPGSRRPARDGSGLQSLMRPSLAIPLTAGRDRRASSARIHWPDHLPAEPGAAGARWRTPTTGPSPAASSAPTAAASPKETSTPLSTSSTRPTNSIRQWWRGRRAAQRARGTPRRPRGVLAATLPTTLQRPAHRPGAVNAARHAANTCSRQAGTVAIGSIDETTPTGRLYTRRCFRYVTHQSRTLTAVSRPARPPQDHGNCETSDSREGRRVTGALGPVGDPYAVIV
jgi:hypothetical protein